MYQNQELWQPLLAAQAFYCLCKLTFNFSILCATSVTLNVFKVLFQSECFDLSVHLSRIEQ